MKLRKRSRFFVQGGKYRAVAKGVHLNGICSNFGVARLRLQRKTDVSKEDGLDEKLKQCWLANVQLFKIMS